MNRLLIAAAFAASASLMVAGPAVGQEISAGKTAFAQHCAACHGAEGKGDGLVAELFRQKPKDLTLLAKENGGVFPFESVIERVDGRMATKGHGDTNMPVWGNYFMQKSLSNPSIDPQSAKEIVDGRILSVVYYLQTLQVK